MDEHRPLRTFGRIKARTLKPRQAGLMESLLPHLALPEEGELDVAALFSLPFGGGPGWEAAQDVALASTSGANLIAPHPNPSPKWEGLVLEIGFGGGEHLVGQATAHPRTRLIGVEPFINGVASCLRHIEEANVQNVRLHNGDARDVVARLPNGSVDLVYILFPDPWPKARHHKRRLIQGEFLDELARVMKPGGELRFATDWANYASWTLEQVTRHPRFHWTAESAADWRNAWPGHTQTRYETKKLGDCAPIWLRFVRG